MGFLRPNPWVVVATVILTDPEMIWPLARAAAFVRRRIPHNVMDIMKGSGVIKFGYSTIGKPLKTYLYAKQKESVE